jgi:hypothetical protein
MAPRVIQPQAVTIEVVVDTDEERSPTSSVHKVDMEEKQKDARAI